MTEFHIVKLAIKEHGNWFVVIKPLKFSQVMDLDECESLLKRSQVSHGFLLYPYFNEERDQGITLGNDYAESAAIFKSKKEICRLYTSGLFAHRFACQEDIWDETKEFHILEILHTTRKITQIYQFASNLATENIFGNDVEIKFMLYSMKDRTLMFTDPMRDLDHTYKCHIEMISIVKNVTATELIASYQEYAIQTTIDLFHLFNWKASHLYDLLRTEQESFLSGK